MKNNRGFSILELIVSFSLTMIIVVVLFEIIIYMKELYEKSVTQTELLNKQNLITDYIYSDIYTYELDTISVCGDNCIVFDYSMGTPKYLKWDTSLNTIGYGDYTISLLKNTYFDQTLLLSDGTHTLSGAKICYTYDDGNNPYVSIKIPITNALFPEDDFGINLLYYDTNEYATAVFLPASNDCS
ncbi:MAG: prepilin-type N-terminal cleavage/methylation domain-containing protein [Firmicutes bacterium]|nr:prepilin-type N-terminal cleavage/methylation domain-containing protein [Bacillota bacterium]